jgi:hypothetical protein
MTSNSKSEGRFGKQDFVYVGADDIYLCPAGERPRSAVQAGMGIGHVLLQITVPAKNRNLGKVPSPAKRSHLEGAGT